MQLLNFKSLHKYSASEQELETIENKQRLVLKNLRKQYEQLLLNRKQRKLSSAEKFRELNKIRGSYTFKLPTRPSTNHTDEDVTNFKKRSLSLRKRLRSVENNAKSISPQAVASQRPHSSPADKLHKRKSLCKAYTFKLPLNAHRERGDNELHEIFTNDPFKNARSETRSRMIAAGNSFSMRNKYVFTPRIATEEMATAKTTEAPRHARLLYARALGNRYSRSYRGSVGFGQLEKPRWKLHLERKSYKQLVNRKERLEWTHRNSMKFNRMLPDGFFLDYFDVVDKICYYEDTFDFRGSGVEDSFACQEILQLNRPNADQSLINEMRQPNISRLRVNETKREMFRAIGSVEIGSVLQAATAVEADVERALKSEFYVPFDDDKRFEEDLQEARSTVQTAVEDEALLSELDDEEYVSNANESVFEDVSPPTTIIPEQKDSLCCAKSSSDLTPNAEYLTSCESIEENADIRQKLLSSHEICKCDGTRSSTSSAFEMASEGGREGLANIIGMMRKHNESDNDGYHYVNECTHEYSGNISVRCNAAEKLPSIETVSQVINF